MENYEKIAVLEDRFQAQALEEELQAREIPFRLRSFHDTAYDGLFQLGRGWGRIDAPLEYKEEILSILADLARTGEEA